MKNLLFLLLLTSLSVAGCRDDDDQLDPLREAELGLSYRAEYGGTPLDIQREVYNYPTGDSLKVLLFQYYHLRPGTPARRRQRPGAPGRR